MWVIWVPNHGNSLSLEGLKRERSPAPVSKELQPVERAREVSAKQWEKM